MSRWRRHPFLWASLALLSVGLLLPVGMLFVRSFLAYDVVQTDGTVYRAAGDVIEQPDEVLFTILDETKNEVNQVSVLREDLAQVRTVVTLEHYGRVFGDERTRSLLRNSAWIGLGGALLALLLGLPVAWVLARARLSAPWPRRWRRPAGHPRTAVAARSRPVAAPAWIAKAAGALRRGAAALRPSPRALTAALCLGPAVLPPFFIALGGARSMQKVLIDLFGVSGGMLQILNSICVFGCVLFPVYVLFAGPALASVPAGPWESARMLGGRRAAWRHVTLPHVLPSILGAFALAFVLALTDFAVPDVLGFMLPGGGAPTHVFATEILFQWKQQSNTARAVATAAPFVLVVTVLLVLALGALRRSPAFDLAGAGARRRPRRRVGPVGSVLCVLFVTGVLTVSLGVPMVGIASWAGTGAESTAGGSVDPSGKDASGVELFDFTTTLDRTPGARSDRNRWLLTALVAALLAMAMAVPLARLATRAGRAARLFVLVVGGVPLAVPGLALSAGTLLLWRAVPGDWMRPLEASVLRSALALSVKFLPFALVGAWLALRGIRRGHEEAAATLGAGPLMRGWRILLPIALTGVLAGGLAVFTLALRELDTVVLIDVQILPMRLYDKIHFKRMAEEANLLILCQLYLMGPAMLAALLLGLRRGRHRDPESP